MDILPGYPVHDIFLVYIESVMGNCFCKVPGSGVTLLPLLSTPLLICFSFFIVTVPLQLLVTAILKCNEIVISYY